MARRWRIIDTPPADPFTNMAIDEALLRGYALHSSPPTLRIYGWQPAALSIGYAQDADSELDIAYCRRSALAFVRRITGGGIIRHSDELTYSLVLSKADLGIPERVVSSYRVISSFLIEFYRRLGLEASFACDAATGERLGAGSPLCFASKEKYDIVVGGRKIGGSAQKRSRDVIFQHGSIPLGRTDGDIRFLRDKPPAAPKTASLEELLGRMAGATELKVLLVEAFRATFGVEAQCGELSGEEMRMAGELRDSKYKSDEWNYNRSDLTCAVCM